MWLKMMIFVFFLFVVIFIFFVLFVLMNSVVLGWECLFVIVCIGLELVVEVSRVSLFRFFWKLCLLKLMVIKMVCVGFELEVGWDVKWGNREGRNGVGVFCCVDGGGSEVELGVRCFVYVEVYGMGWYYGGDCVFVYYLCYGIM